MIAKSVGWTTSGASRHPDPVESDIISLGPDEVLVRIEGHDVNRAGFADSRDREQLTPESLQVCRGVLGRVIEAGANALWYVDRAVIVPAQGRCVNCDAGQRDRAMTRFSEEAREKDGDGIPAKFVVMRAQELCVASVITDWQKPTST